MEWRHPPKGTGRSIALLGDGGRAVPRKAWSSPQPWEPGLATRSPNTRMPSRQAASPALSPQVCGETSSGFSSTWVWFAGNKGTHGAGSPLGMVGVRPGILGEALLTHSAEASSNQQVCRIHGMMTHATLVDKAGMPSAPRIPWGFVTWAKATVLHQSPSSSGPGPRPPEWVRLGCGRVGCEGLGTPGSRRQLSR